MTQLTKFQTIALPLAERGFPVTPVRPDAKAGAAGKWNHWQYRTPNQVLTLYVEKYADCNAGVVGRRGIGNLCFLDDDGGVPDDIIARFPRTYVVRTRPDSTHQHFYFLQTAYSFKKFGPNARTINVRDTRDIVASPSGGVMYKTLFDMKGIGGASLVVAAGSTKPNGDKYTCVDDGDVAPIPDWLVDWVIKQQGEYRLALVRIQKRHQKDKRRATKFAPEVRARLRADGHPDGFDVFPIDRQRFTRSLAFKLARLGVTGEMLVTLLIDQICRYVEGGTAYCQTERALESIQAISRHAEEMTKVQRDREMDFYADGKQAVNIDGVIHAVEIPEPTRRDVLREIVREFPDRLSCDEADARFRDALDMAGLAPFDKRRDRTALYDLRRGEGFEVSTVYWTRMPMVPSPPLHNTGEVTDMSLRTQGDQVTLFANAKM